MRHRLFSIFLLLPLLFGCEYEFDLKNLEGESRLQLTSLSGMCDSTYFNVYKAAAVNSHDTCLAVIEDMVFAINGQPQRISEDSSDGSSLFIVNAPVKGGDRISLRVKADGLKEACSETVVPEKAAVSSIKAEFKEELVNSILVADTGDFLYFDIGLEGNVTEDDYFAVEIKVRSKHTFTYEDGYVEEYEQEYYQSIYDNSDFLSFESGKGGGWYNTSSSGLRFGDFPNHHELYVTSGKSVVDGHLSVKSYFNHNYAYEREFFHVNDNGDTEMLYGMDEGNYSYQLVVYKVSPELFRYCKAKSLQGNNALAEAGLSPPTFSYTNVKNGFGVVCAISEPVFSEWVLSPGI